MKFEKTITEKKMSRGLKRQFGLSFIYTIKKCLLPQIMAYEVKISLASCKDQ